MDPALLHTWKKWSPALDPYYAIKVDEVERLYAPRAQGAADRLVLRIRRAVEPERLKILLCGARGSGKTTEMARVAHSLYLEWAPLRIDLASILPAGSATLAICVHIGAAALRALHDRSAQDQPLAPAAWSAAGRLFGAALEGLGVGSEALATLLDAMPAVSALVVPKEGAVPAEAAPLVARGVGAGLKAAGAQVRARAAAAAAAVSGPLGRYVAPDEMDKAQRVIEGINAILDELQRHEQRPILLLVEGLDKSHQLDDIRLAISQPELLEQIGAPLILTGPIQLRSSPEFSGLPGSLRPEPMNNIPVLAPPFTDPQVHPAGIDALLDLYTRRRDHFGLPKDLFPPEELARAARYSSGVPREFLTLLDLAGQEALQAGRARVLKQDLDGALRERRLTLTGAYTEARVLLLYRVLQRGVPGDGPEADELLFTNYIAAYPNGELWYRPNELLVDSVRERGALLERLAGGS